ncbi:BppU family phage baseplate upper protein [uncultured Senegalimassilia sp.]|uniref:BppU family phage baseplate upper protein n=1 Tax=uncultured Senegalimassilia sp. TaxID=1714350 RepID=UPI0026E04D47|nr:BppU family phage baseplate upper protein [uncultured Senegalimassilia sp.]
MNVQTIELDVNKRGCGNNCIRIAQGEGGGTTIKALIYDNGGELALSGYSAFLVARLPDRIHYYRGSATVSGNTITYVCDESKLASVPGYTDEAYFEIVKGDFLAQTERFALDILRSAKDGQQPAQSWDNAIDDLIKRGETAVKSSEAAVAAANGAVSKADTATGKANAAAREASAATGKANAAAGEANTAAEKADTAAGKANTSAEKADTAAQGANDAKTEALKAAEEARGSISPDKRLYIAYDTVGDTDYISLVDTED